MTATKLASTDTSAATMILRREQRSSNPQNADKVKEAFGAFLNQASGNGFQDKTKKPDENNKLQMPYTLGNQKYFGKEYQQSQSQYKDLKISKSEQPQSSGRVANEVKDKLAGYSENVKDVLKDKLNVTDEELEQAMQTLGLTFADLMNPANLANLAAELTGSMDTGALLLSEDFQLLLTQVGELTKSLLADLNLTLEQLWQLVEQAKSAEGALLPEDVAQGADVSDIGDTKEETVEKDTPVQQPEQGLSKEEQEAIHHDTGNVDTVEDENAKGVRAASKESNEISTETSVDAAKDTAQGLSNGSNQGASSENDLTKQDNSNTQAQTTYHTIQTVAGTETIAVTQPVQQPYVDVQDIIRQVSQFTRVNIGQLDSTIQMQLNPANLGKIYIQVVARDGMITAQIAAQNTIVKEAMEAQASILKENMNQQGMKVEAVEITVATHEFEQNLEQDQSRFSQAWQEEAAKQSRRNLNLNNLEEREDILSEEENLVARMMSEQGNSVDMSA
ncbi:flagellar hook-length control protein FliK [Lachnospiraceae bacterium ZAX-1]